MEKGFEVVTLSGMEMGLLKTVGNREVVISVKKLPGADTVDNDWLMESVKTIYMQYYSRVADYTRMEER